MDLLSWRRTVGSRVMNNTNYLQLIWNLYGSYTVQFSYAGETSGGYVTVYKLTILYT